MKRIAFFVIVLSLLAAPAFAKDKTREIVVVGDGHPVVVTGSRKCPPGLAKKNALCVPPGQYKKMYRVGDVLPGDVVWRRPSSNVLRRLDPPPYGYRYVQVDQDILLINDRSREIDAIMALMSLMR